MILTFRMLFVTFLLPPPTGHASRLGPIAEHPFSPFPVHVQSRLRTPICAVIPILLGMLIVVVFWTRKTVSRAHRIVVAVLALQGFHHPCVRVVRSRWSGGDACDARVHPLLVLIPRHLVPFRSRVQLRRLRA